MSESEYFAPDALRVFRVARQTHPRDMGLQLAQVLFGEARRLELVAVGPSAVNQAVKAIAVTRSHLNKMGRDCCFIPRFQDELVGDAEEERTAIHFLVEERTLAPEPTL